MTLNHFQMSLLFAAVSSIILGVVTKRTDRERVQYGLYCFACFLVALFGIAWAMKLLHG